MRTARLYRWSPLVALALFVGCSNQGDNVRGINLATSNFSGPVAIVFGDPLAPPLKIEDGWAQIDPSTSNMVRTSSSFIPTTNWRLNGQDLPRPGSPSDQIALRRTGQGSFRNSMNKVFYIYAHIGPVSDFRNTEEFETLLGQHATHASEHIMAKR
jgi:hypothetical protein